MATTKLVFGSQDQQLVFWDASGVVFRCAGKRPFFSSPDDALDDDYYDEQLPDNSKKRRLTVEQVRLLEKSFEEDNKLEPERKAALARQLLLQPRQVAVWFQNRRARWKTKQLERDFECLKAELEALRSDHGALADENLRLRAQVHAIVLFTQHAPGSTCVMVLTQQLHAQEARSAGADDHELDEEYASTAAAVAVPAALLLEPAQVDKTEYEEQLSCGASFDEHGTAIGAGHLVLDGSDDQSYCFFTGDDDGGDYGTNLEKEGGCGSNEDVCSYYDGGGEHHWTPLMWS